jgi:hypothetical protein
MANLVVSIGDYCKKPDDYIDKLPDSTITYYNQYCNSLKSLNDNSRDGGGIDIGEFGSDVEKGVENFIQNMITPEALSMMAKITGDVALYKLTFKTLIPKMIESYTEFSAKFSADLVAEEGLSEVAVNMASMMTTMVAEASITVMDGTVYAVGTIFKAIEFLADGILDLVPGLGEVLMALQLLGSIFDAIDPCNMSEALNSDTIKAYNISYNESFRKNMLVGLNSFKDPYGNITYSTQWPVEYYADDSILVTMKKDYYMKEYVRYAARYINSLSFNSLGQPIHFPPPGSGTIIKPSHLQKIGQRLSSDLGGGNTVVSRWIDMHLPLVILALVGLLFLVFFLLKKKKYQEK